MSNTYKVKVNDLEEFNISTSDLNTIDAISVGDSGFHVLKDNISYTAEVTSSDFLSKTYTVLINNNTYSVVIANPLDQLIEEMGFHVGESVQVNEVKAPIPGLILEINVEPGQEVKENDSLIILEAMKMENTLVSPRSGTIKTVAVNKGDAVDKGRLLIEFE